MRTPDAAAPSPQRGAAAQAAVAAADPLRRLVAIIALLRSPEGCPWDRKQTHASLRPHLIEEAYEVIDAIDSGGHRELAEELGDLLLQVVLHSQIAAERGDFGIDAVATAICDKLIHRHPHVFGAAEVADADGVVEQWDRLKAAEKPDRPRRSITDELPRYLPALLRAAKLQKRVARVGFDWGHASDVVAKIEEELGEVRQALAAGDHRHIEEELGDLLFAAVNLVRFLKIDPELALDRSTAKFIARFRKVEERAAAEGRPLTDYTLAELDRFWDEAKEGEKMA